MHERSTLYIHTHAKCQFTRYTNVYEYSPAAVLAQSLDDGLGPGGEVAVGRVDLQRAHVHALQRVVAEKSVKDGGVHRAAYPHEKVVAVLEQEDAVGRQSAKKIRYNHYVKRWTL